MILLACQEVPGDGGAATSGYAHFARLQDEGLPVAWVNLVDRADLPWVRHVFGPSAGNPEGRPDCHLCPVDPPLHGPQPGLAALIGRLDPDLLVGRGHGATAALAAQGGGRGLVHLTVGCRAAIAAIESGAARDLVDFERRARAGRRLPPARLERRALEAADLVVAHAPVVARLLALLHPDLAGKLHPTIVWNPGAVAHLRAPPAAARPFAERDVDVLFAASRWTRPEKGWPTVRAIARRCRDLSVAVLGETPGEVPGAACPGLVTDRAAMADWLGRSRAVVCPSRADAAPDLLFEAAGAGCNVVASPNCGNWELCPPALRVPTPGVAGFVAAIRRAVREPLAPCAAPFLADDGHAELRELYEVLAGAAA